MSDNHRCRWEDVWLHSVKGAALHTFHMEACKMGVALIGGADEVGQWPGAGRLK